MRGRRNRQTVILDGCEISLVTAAYSAGIIPSTVRKRLKMGWLIEEALGRTGRVLRKVRSEPRMRHKPDAARSFKGNEAINQDTLDRIAHKAADANFQAAMIAAGIPVGICTTPGTDRPRPTLRHVNVMQSGNVTYPAAIVF